MLMYGSAMSISVVDIAWIVPMENIPNPISPRFRVCARISRNARNVYT